MRISKSQPYFFEPIIQGTILLHMHGIFIKLSPKDIPRAFIKQQYENPRNS